MTWACLGSGVVARGRSSRASRAPRARHGLVTAARRLGLAAALACASAGCRSEPAPGADEAPSGEPAPGVGEAPPSGEPAPGVGEAPSGEPGEPRRALADLVADPHAGLMAGLSPLSTAPDWSELDAFQESMTREELVRLLEDLYAPGGASSSFIHVHETHATVFTSRLDPTRTYTLRFASAPREPAPPAPDRAAREPAPDRAAHDRALEGLTIAIDPGHIGGQWGRREGRWFRIGDSAPVVEGDLNLRVARLLATELEALGARAVLVRDQQRPVTAALPRELEPLARALLLQRGELSAGLSRAEEHARIEQESVALAYRTSEIRARARLVNEQIRPDLTICVHFDAAAWKNPRRANLTDRNHLHLIVHGAYTAGELAYEDARFHLLHKLLSRNHEVELALAQTVAQAMATATGLPPPPGYPHAVPARRMSADGYVWARNLLANRLYRGPVLYLEPYVMNDRDVFARLQAGDYAGLRFVGNARRPSIFREYADAVTRGLVRFYGDTTPRSR